MMAAVGWYLIPGSLASCCLRLALDLLRMISRMDDGWSIYYDADIYLANNVIKM